MKNILFLLFILCFTLTSSIGNGQLPVKNGKLSGVVTYKDSYELANQADAGCEIYVINEIDLRSTEFEAMPWVMENFQINKSENTILVNNTIDPVKIKQLQDKLDTVSAFTAKQVKGFKQLPAIVKTSTNATGNYTLKLMPGKYYIMIVSGHVKSNNLAETKGNIVFETVEIKSSLENFVDVSFVKHEMIWIKQVTRRKPVGC